MTAAKNAQPYGSSSNCYLSTEVIQSGRDGLVIFRASGTLPSFPTRDARLSKSLLRIAYNPARDEICTMKKPSKTAAELEASIKVEMEDICDWPTDMMISVQPDGDSWKVAVMQEGSVDDAGRREMVEQIAARLKTEYDLKG